MAYGIVADGKPLTARCGKDVDCAAGEYCDAGVDLDKNRCEPKKDDNEACDLVGGGHQCKGGRCAFGRCYTLDSVAMGGTCYVGRRVRRRQVQRRRRGPRQPACATATPTAARDNGATPASTSRATAARRSRPTTRPATWSAAATSAGAASCSFGRLLHARRPSPRAAPATSTPRAAPANAAPSTAPGAPACASATATAARAGGATPGCDTKLNACRAKLDNGETCGKLRARSATTTSASRASAPGRPSTSARSPAGSRRGEGHPAVPPAGQEHVGQLGEAGPALGLGEPARAAGQGRQEAAQVGDADAAGREEREHRLVVGRIAGEREAAAVPVDVDAERLAP